MVYFLFHILQHEVTLISMGNFDENVDKKSKNCPPDSAVLSFSFSLSNYYFLYLCTLKHPTPVLTRDGAP